VGKFEIELADQLRDTTWTSLCNLGMMVAAARFAPDARTILEDSMKEIEEASDTLAKTIAMLRAHD